MYGFFSPDKRNKNEASFTTVKLLIKVEMLTRLAVRISQPTR